MIEDIGSTKGTGTGTGTGTVNPNFSSVLPVQGAVAKQASKQGDGLIANAKTVLALIT